MAAIRSSPLPPPTEMEKYEGLMPGATETLFRNFINQSNHRMELEKETIRGDNRRADRGQIFSFILGILCILIGCVALFFIDKSGFAIAAIITAIAPIATAFLGASLSRKKERENKRKQMGA
jgi:drug/metabolite transporter (DMT)-like permease